MLIMLRNVFDQPLHKDSTLDWGSYKRVGPSGLAELEQLHVHMVSVRSQ